MNTTNLNKTRGATGANGQAGSAGITGLDPIGTNSNERGMTLTGTTLGLQAASSSYGGVLTGPGTSQNISGEKTFDETVNTEGNFNMPTTTSANAACC